MFIEKEAKQKAAQSAADTAGKVSKKIQETTSRRRIKRQEKITCAKFSTDSDEFSKIELTGTAEEINQKIAKYSG